MGQLPFWKISIKRPGENKITVTNFPDLSEFDDFLRDAPPARKRRFVYAGSITRPRGALEMVEAMRHVKSADATLALMGKFDTEALETTARIDEGWHRVDFKGWSSRGDRRGWMRVRLCRRGCFTSRHNM